MDEAAVTSVVPLLFLVVTQLAQVGRKLDLQAAVTEDRHPLGIPILDWVPGVPAFGQFNFIHGANLTQLTVGLLLIAVLSEGWIQLGLTVLTWAMFVILPVLEVESYDEIVTIDDPPYTLPVLGSPFYSFHANLVSSTAITAFTYRYQDRFRTEIPSEVGEYISGSPEVVLLICIATIGYVTFLYILHQELERVNVETIMGL